MSDSAYARAGVDQTGAGSAVGALVAVLAGIETGAPSRSVLASGHYAAVLRLDDRRGLALSCDGVGTKVVVAERLGRLDTVGIDCIAMNVNDVICVGAEPIAVLDYIAVEEADPAALEQIALGLRAGAEAAGVEIPGGELAVLPELIRGHPSPHGFDLLGFCIGLVDLDAIVTGASIEPGDAIVGVPSSGIHSNGLTLARRVLGDDDERLLEPTAIYVRAVRDLLDRGRVLHLLLRPVVDDRVARLVHALHVHPVSGGGRGERGQRQEDGKSQCCSEARSSRPGRLRREQNQSHV